MPELARLQDSIERPTAPGRYVLFVPHRTGWHEVDVEVYWLDSRNLYARRIGGPDQVGVPVNVISPACQWRREA